MQCGEIEDITGQRHLEWLLAGVDGYSLNAGGVFRLKAVYHGRADESVERTLPAWSARLGAGRITRLPFAPCRRGLAPYAADNRIQRIMECGNVFPLPRLRCDEVAGRGARRRAASS